MKGPLCIISTSWVITQRVREFLQEKKKKKRVGERESVCKYENNITMNNHKICDE